MSPEKKKNPGGRPRKYSNPDDMQEKIDKYFDEAADKPTVTGLAIVLGLDRHQLINYSHDESFYHTIKLAKQRVQQALEKHLYSQSVAGVIFSLKNNFGWRDTQEININDVTPSRLRLEEQLANMGDAERRELLARELEKTGQFKRIAAA